MNLMAPSENIEKIFEKYFQKSISLFIKGEVVKKGKFLLIKNCIVGNNFYFEFTIKREKKIDTVRIPYPFLVEEYQDENLLYLDYRLDTLFRDSKHSQFIKQWALTDDKMPNKLFDNILEIKFE
jgi:hypothetical protein